MKNLKLKLPILLVILFIIFMYSKPVYAAYPTYKNDWEWNYNGAAYYYIVNLSPKFQESAKEAASNWYKTGYHTNPLYPMTRTSTQSESPIDLYKSNLGKNTYGRTDFYVLGGTKLDFGDNNYGPLKDWLYCKILINESLFNEDFGDNPTKRKILIAHEMGHAFGLAHNTSSTNLVMYTYIELNRATKITKDDSAALVQKLKF